ncbi:MAG: hypothetical protein JWM89_1609 [Acidimicrobiales bacterium]|nr:hypothetical protein [Acidimicrobiales bacterium]
MTITVMQGHSDRWRGRPHATWTRPLARLGASGALLGLLAALMALGHGRLAGPTGWSDGEVRTWAEGRDAVTIAMAGLRVVALALVGQLGLAAGVTALGTALRLPALVRAADLLTMPGTRGLMRRLAGLGLSAASLASPAGHAHHGVAVHHREPAARAAPTLAPHTATLRSIEVGGSRRATLQLLPASGGAASNHAATITQLPDRVAPANPHPLPVSGSTSGGTWRVDPGDHLWSIAETTLTRTWHRAPTEPETDGYWRAVIAENPQITEPDLLHPGQIVRLPPPPAPDSSR